MRFSLTLKQKMIMVLVIAVAGFALVSGLALSGLGKMGSALEKADAVARSVDEAMQLQLTLLRLADDSRQLTTDRVSAFLSEMDGTLKQEEGRIEAQMAIIAGTDLAGDIGWMREAGEKYRQNLHRVAELQSKLGFSADEGLKGAVITQREKVKEDIWISSAQPYILAIQDVEVSYWDNSTPEAAQQVIGAVQDAQMKLKEFGLDNMKNPDDVAFSTILDTYLQRFKEADSVQAQLRPLNSATTELLNGIKQRSLMLSDHGGQLLDAARKQGGDTRHAAFAQQLGGAAVTGILLCLVLFWIIRDMSGTMKRVIAIVNQVSDGDFQIRIDNNRRDEFGHLLTAVERMVNSLKQVCQALDSLAAGNLNYDLEVDPNKKEELRRALLKVRDDLSSMVTQQLNSGQQISAGSTSVSDFAQTLSQGASESAASLEEISSSLNQMAGQTRMNADNANMVNQLSSEAKQASEEGNRKMDRMTAAMAEISTASESISKIIKVIDEIAFQTNLLALNAAVEAARAASTAAFSASRLV